MRAGAAGLLLLLAAPAAGTIDFAALQSDSPPTSLAATGIFADPAARRLSADVLPYELAAPLFSDHAAKQRGIALPPGTQARMQGDGLIDFPVGTVLVKSFGFGLAATGTIETRLLVRRASGWVALPYVWYGTDARLRKAGATVATTALLPDGARQPIDWQVPNVNQCKTCHAQAGALTPIGPKARNLVGTGALHRLAARGWLQGFDSANPPVAVPSPFDAAAPLDQRARAYLDANCGHCHARGGSASNSGLLLDWAEADPVARGLGKRPVAAGRGSGGMSFAVHPGAPDQSILLFRMASVEPGVMMPELGRSLPDPEGLALVRAWIESLAP